MSGKRPRSTRRGLLVGAAGGGGLAGIGGCLDGGTPGEPRTPHSDRLDTVSDAFVYEYYEGNFGSLPDFQGFAPRDVGTTDTISTKVARRTSGYGLVFEREIPVGQRFDPGEYTFTLTAEPAGRVAIDGTTVIDATRGGTQTTGSADLEAGTRTLRVEYANGTGDGDLGLGWEDPYEALLPRISRLDPLRQGQKFDWEMDVGVNGAETKRMPVPSSGPRSISVALYPNTNFCFDTSTGTVRYGWRGGFLDTGPMIAYGNGRGNDPANVLGTRFEAGSVESPLRVGDPETAPTVEFRGYSEASTPPTLTYSVDGHEATHAVESAAGGVGLAHSITFEDPPEAPCYYVTETDADLERDAVTGSWSNGVLEVPAGASTLEFTIAPAGGDLS